MDNCEYCYTSRDIYGWQYSGIGGKFSCPGGVDCFKIFFYFPALLYFSFTLDSKQPLFCLKYSMELAPILEATVSQGKASK